MLPEVLEGSGRNSKKLSEAARHHAGGRLTFGESQEPDAKEAVSEALAAWGLVAVGELNLDDEFWLWPENEESFCLWLAVQTQWHRIDGHPCGMNYQSYQLLLEMRGVAKERRERLFSEMQVMESACLSEWARNR